MKGPVQRMPASVKRVVKKDKCSHGHGSPPGRAPGKQSIPEQARDQHMRALVQQGNSQDGNEEKDPAHPPSGAGYGVGGGRVGRG